MDEWTPAIDPPWGAGRRELPVNGPSASLIFSPSLSARGGAAEDAGDEGGGCELVVLGHLGQLFPKLRQRLPHPTALLRGAGGEERPGGVPRLPCGVPGLQRAAVSR